MDTGRDESLETTHRIRCRLDLVDRPLRNTERRGVDLHGRIDDLVRMATRRIIVRRIEVAGAGGLGDEGVDPLLGIAPDHDRVQQAGARLDVDETHPVLGVGQCFDRGRRTHLLLNLVVTGLDALDRGPGRGAGERPGAGDRPDVV